MRFASVFVLSLAAGILGAPLEPQMSQVKRQNTLNGGVYYCTAVNFAGTCVRTPPITEACNNFDSAFNDQVSSFRPEPAGSVVCLLWSEQNCTGTNPGGWIGNPVDDLRTINFNDVASSFQCKNP